MAALTPCQDCKKEISKKAKTCPYCGSPQRKQYGWGTVLFFVFVGMFIYGFGAGDRSPSDMPTQKPSAFQGTGKCRKFIELHSAAHDARELGTSEDWVVQNYRINLWEKTTAQGKAKVVGKLLPGSRALLIETSGQDFKVQSPYDNSIGWVSQAQVSSFLMLNDITFAPCN